MKHGLIKIPRCGMWRAAGFLTLLLASTPLFAQGVAIVTDLAGKAVMQGAAGQAKITIMSEIAASAQVELNTASRLTVIYLSSGDEYAFAGPSRIQFHAYEPQMLSGSAPQRRPSPLGRGANNVKIKVGSVIQAGFVMRGGGTAARIRLLTLAGTKTLESSPEFRWQESDPGVKYHFKLSDDSNNLVYEADVEGTAFKLPAAIRLNEGVDFTWELSAQLSDGRRYVSTGDFSLAERELRSQVETLRPAAGAPVAERVLFAAWLERVELRDEARKYWKTLASERPDDEGLQILSGEPSHAPRTIDDVAAILDYYRPTEERLQVLREGADAQPPENGGTVELAAFYRKRATAARALGRIEQQVADLKQALQYAAQHKFADEERILMNLGAAYSLTGDAAAAIETRQQALRLVAPKEHGRQLIWTTFISTMLAAYGDLEQARAYLERAEILLDDSRFRRGRGRRSRDYWQWAVSRAKGAWLAASGRHAEAEPFLRRAVRHYERWMAGIERPGFMQAAYGGRVYTDWTYEQTLTELSRCLTAQGRLKEGEIEMRHALELALSRGGRDTAETAAILQSFAINLFEQGRFAETDRIVDKTLEIYDRLGVPPSAFRRIGARTLRFRTLAARGQWQQAFAEAESIRQASGPSGAFERQMARSAAWPWVLAKSGNYGEAIAVARDYHALFVTRFGRQRTITALVQAALGHALAESGRLPEALAAFRQAVPALIAGVNRRTQAVQSGRSLQELYVALEAYLDLIAKIHAQSQQRGAADRLSDDAFRVAEALQGGRLQNAVAAAAARASVGDPGLADLVRNEQDTRLQIRALNELHAEKASLPPARRDEKLELVLRDRLREKEDLAADLEQQIRNRFPRYANLLAPAAPNPAEVRGRLAPGESLVVLQTTEKNTFIWAMAREKPVAFAVMPTSRSEIATLVQNLRAALDHHQVMPERFPEFDLAAAHRLYVELLQPVESTWKDTRTLMVVTSGALAALPLSVLSTKATTAAADHGLRFDHYQTAPWLIRQIAVAQLPSVGALMALRALPRANPDRVAFAGFGDPQFGPQLAVAAAPTSAALRMRSVALPRSEAGKSTDWVPYSRLAPLPDTREEILAIAAALNADPGKDVFLGPAASKSRVKSMDLAKRRIVAFATHGLIPGDFPDLDQPALALSAPDGNPKAGLLTLEDILGLKMDADWVVLSACNTAAGEDAGAEAVSGLGRGFFYAGNRALLVTDWPVETRSARLLVTNLFDRYSSSAVSRADALRQASLAVMAGAAHDESGKPLFSYAHPAFWAPYVLVGDGGR